MLTKSEAVFQHFEIGEAIVDKRLDEGHLQLLQAANDPEYARQRSLERRGRRHRRAIAAARRPVSGWRVSLW